MAKRSRGGPRPGQLRPTTRRSTAQRPAARSTTSAGPAPATTLSSVEEARAAELEAQIVAQERAAEAARRRPKGRGRVEYAAAGGRGESSLLAARSAEEYAYVRRDLLRIGKVGGAITGVVAVLWVLIDLLHVIRI